MSLVRNIEAFIIVGQTDKQDLAVYAMQLKIIQVV